MQLEPCPDRGVTESREQARSKNIGRDGTRMHGPWRFYSPAGTLSSYIGAAV